MIKNKFSAACKRCLLAFAIVFPQALAAQAADVTPSDVFSSLDLLNRSLDVVLQVRGVAAPAAPASIESGLGPFHVYQLHVACLELLCDLEAKLGMTPLPLVISQPVKYTPADVVILTQLMTADVRRLAGTLEVEGLPNDRIAFSGKTPTDVFQEVLALYVRLSALSGHTQIEPSEVYAQLVRSVRDTASILAHVDTARRYRIDVPAAEGDKAPAEVFARCLEVRHTINQVRQELGLGTTPVPVVAAGQALRLEDVFFQTQIIIAELNLLKLGTGTTSGTPLAITVSDKTPADAYRQVATVDYLLKQISQLRGLTTNSQVVN